MVAPHSRDAYRHLTYGPAAAVAGGVHETWDIVSTTSYYIGRLVTGRVSADQLGGPLRTAQLSGAVATAAAHSERDLPTKAFAVLVGLAQLAAFISVSIGFVNLLPIPVLDGGISYSTPMRRWPDGPWPSRCRRRVIGWGLPYCSV